MSLRLSPVANDSLSNCASQEGCHLGAALVLTTSSAWRTIVLPVTDLVRETIAPTAGKSVQRTAMNRRA